MQCFDSEFSQGFSLNILHSQLGTSEVKLGSKLPKRGQIGLVGQNISNIHKLRPRILWAISILPYLRSNKVIQRDIEKDSEIIVNPRKIK